MAISIADEYRDKMKAAFDFLLTKRVYIKNIIKNYSNIHDVMEIICKVFDGEYLSIYPNNYSIFNVINESEFFDWCKENIEGFQGNIVEQNPQYWCGMKESSKAVESEEAENYYQKVGLTYTGKEHDNFYHEELMTAFDAGVEFEKKKHEWHNVKIELPKESREYLVSYDENCKNRFYVLHYDTSNWYELYEEESGLIVSKPYWWKEIE